MRGLVHHDRLSETNCFDRLLLVVQWQTDYQLLSSRSVMAYGALSRVVPQHVARYRPQVFQHWAELACRSISRFASLSAALVCGPMLAMIAESQALRNSERQPNSSATRALHGLDELMTKERFATFQSGAIESRFLLLQLEKIPSDKAATERHSHHGLLCQR